MRENPSVGRYAVVAILFALGLMAKPQIITTPLVLLLWDYWPFGRMFSSQRESSGREYAARPFAALFLEKIPLLLLSTASAIITMKAQQAGGAVRTAVEFSFAVRAKMQLSAYARYLGKAFWPGTLAPLYPHPGNFLASWQLRDGWSLFAGGNSGCLRRGGSDISQWAGSGSWARSSR